MPGRAPAQGGQPRQPFGPQLKAALVQAAPLFSAMAAGYSSGRGPYAYLDQGIAGMQAMQKQKRDEEAAAAAAAAFGGLVPGGMGPAMSTKGGGSGGTFWEPGGKLPAADVGAIGATGGFSFPGQPKADVGAYGAQGGLSFHAPSAAPEGWDAIRNGIFAGESGGDYDALFGFSNRDGGQFSNVKLTDMTVDQALQFASPSGPYGQWVKGQVGRVATPMGAYQIVGTTLQAAKEGLGLTGNEKMTPELQEKLGQWIYAQQGTGAWEGYRGPQAAPEGGWGGGSVTMSAKGETGPVDPLADPYVQRLMQVMAMPGLTPEQQAVVQLQLETRMGQLTAPNPDADEDRARERRARDAELLGYGRGTPEWNQYVVTGEIPKGPTPTDDMREYDMAKSQGYTGTFQQYQIDMKKAGATTNNISVGGGPEMGKLSTDYGYVLDENGNPKIDPITGLPTAAPVPGSPAAIEAAQAADKARMRNEAMVKTAEIVTGKIQEARDILNQSSALNPATGFGAETAAGIGGTNAANMKAATDTIVASIAFDELQAMRESSPTGGALGAVSDTEMGLLSAAIASLSQTQSPEQFAKHLDDVERIYGDVMKKFAAYPGAGGVSLGSSPSGGDLGLSDDDLQYLGQP